MKFLEWQTYYSVYNKPYYIKRTEDYNYDFTVYEYRTFWYITSFIASNTKTKIYNDLEKLYQDNYNEQMFLSSDKAKEYIQEFINKYEKLTAFI